MYDVLQIVAIVLAYILGDWLKCKYVQYNKRKAKHNWGTNER